MTQTPSTEWAARVLVYSGRPDPTWTLDPTDVADLRAIWDGLPPGRASQLRTSRLGYRGVMVLDPSGPIWTASGETVEWAWRGGIEVRRDPDRRFERRVLR